MLNVITICMHKDTVVCRQWETIKYTDTFATFGEKVMWHVSAVGEVGLVEHRE